MEVTYPVEPWDLHGEATATVLLVPVQHLPTAPPPGTHLVTVGGRAIVTVAFFRYREPSPLTYGEVMATVLVRRGWRPRVFIARIWVDSPASRDGGRDLWAIPKELATFHGDPGDAMAADGIASLRMRPLLRLPGRLPVAFRVVQQRGNRSVVTPVSARVRMSLACGGWRWSGPLDWLQDRRPWFTVHVRRFALRFGRD